jgi:hypothetical protein
MSTVLLVGIKSPFLKILSAVLEPGWSVHAACEEAELRELLETTEPAVVVFEHTHPFDLFELNPRRFGFAGPILLIADDPSTARSQLQTEHQVKRPSDLVALAGLLRELAEGSNDND